MEDKDGGPAFPVVGAHGTHLNGGMTLRDYFAAKALNGMLSHIDHLAHADPRKAAIWAYEYADAMLAARAATPKR